MYTATTGQAVSAWVVVQGVAEKCSMANRSWQCAAKNSVVIFRQGRLDDVYFVPAKQMFAGTQIGRDKNKAGGFQPLRKGRNTT